MFRPSDLFALVGPRNLSRPVFSRPSLAHFRNTMVRRLSRKSKRKKGMQAMPRALNASVQELARIKPRSARVMAGSWRMARLIIFGKLESVGNDNHDTQKNAP